MFKVDKLHFSFLFIKKRDRQTTIQYLKKWLQYIEEIFSEYRDVKKLMKYKATLCSV